MEIKKGNKNLKKKKIAIINMAFMRVYMLCICMMLFSCNGNSQTAYVDLTAAAEHTINTVVHINAEMEQKSSMWDSFFSDPFFNFFNYKSQPQIYQAYGSGVIISSDGYIVTNNHVVENARKVTVTMNDKRKFEAAIIGNDAETDLALLKIEAKQLDYIVYGNSDEVKLGEWVLAVGNPYNLNSTVTAGVVSAKARNLNILGKGSKVESFIQTDAAVNSGNSGGALVNAKGQLIGINAAIASNTGSYEGYSFAIPVNIVKKVVRDLKSYGRVQHVYIGASFEEVNADMARDLGLESIKGLMIAWLEENGSLMEAGCEKGDIILKIDNQEVNSVSESQEILEQKLPGDKIKLTILHNNKEKTIPITLKNSRGTTEILTINDIDVLDILGAELNTVSDQVKSKYRIQNGVTVTKLKDGLLKKSGIKEGFTILNVDKTPVNSKEDIKQLLKDKKGNVLIEGFYPNGFLYYYNIIL